MPAAYLNRKELAARLSASPETVTCRAAAGRLPRWSPTVSCENTEGPGLAPGPSAVRRVGGQTLTEPALPCHVGCGSEHYARQAVRQPRRPAGRVWLLIAGLPR
jgi:hypothetical protein